ncbi:MAG TPA: NTP transferase domain-containing protein [Gaiellaceae bacterium]
MTVAAVVLAAGASTRYGRPKQYELLPAVLEQLSGVDEVVVVEGAHPLTVDARVVHAAEWERGPGASLRAGLAGLSDEVTHALIVLGDGPALDPRAVQRLIEHRDDAAVLAASYDGTRDHPVLLARDVWDAVPDEGGRALEPLLVDCSDLERPGDVDYSD